MKCEYSIEQQADMTLAEWMHVTGYTDEAVSALSDELVIAIANEAYDLGAEHHVTSGEAHDNPFIEYMMLMDEEMDLRGIRNV